MHLPLQRATMEKKPEVFSMEELILYVKYQAKPGCRETFVRQIVEKGILTPSGRSRAAWPTTTTSPPRTRTSCC